VCLTQLAYHTTADLNYEPEFPCGSFERNSRYFVLFEWLYNAPPFDMTLDFEGKTPSASGLGSNFPFVVEDAFRWDYVFRKFIYAPVLNVPSGIRCQQNSPYCRFDSKTAFMELC